MLAQFTPTDKNDICFGREFLALILNIFFKVKAD